MSTQRESKTRSKEEESKPPRLALRPPPPPRPARPWTSRAPSSLRVPTPPRQPRTPPLPEVASVNAAKSSPTPTCCRAESEVMYYLAHGYKSSHIQQQLYISEGTAKTHIRHIYRKLNIHSQQDLIHLIDGVEL